MMTLREFITQVNSHEHYRVYQPNRDCLIFESYFKVHSPYILKDMFTRGRDYDGPWFNHNYYDNNDYCDDVFQVKKYDQETLDFLETFGDYIVFRMECCSCSPMKMYKGNDGELKIEHLRDSHYPDRDYIPCFNLFIVPADSRFLKENE